MFHRHKWVEIARHFTAPPFRSIDLQSGGADIVRQMVFGITEVEQRCEDCGEVRFVGAVGDARGHR